MEITSATDREYANFLMRHIQTPCIYREMADFYIREAERVIPGMKDEEAISDLERSIRFGKLLLEELNNQ